MNHCNRSDPAVQRDAALHAVSHHRELLGSNAFAVVAGGFNHNVRRDEPRAGEANFRPVLDDLAALGLASVYHDLHVQPSGDESASTPHWRHDPDTPCKVD